MHVAVTLIFVYARGVQRLSHLLLLTLLAVPLSVAAAVYKSIGPDGQVIYSDQPQPGARAVDLPALPPAPPPAASTTQAAPNFAPAASGQDKAAFKGYSTFALVKPTPDETVRENSGVVDVEMTLDPALNTEEGHKITVLLDGKPALEGLTAAQGKLENVERGAHTVQAQVSDAAGKILISSAAVTFNMKRESSALRNPNNPLLVPKVPQVPQAPRL